MIRLVSRSRGHLRRIEFSAAPLPNDLLALHGTFSTGLFYVLIKKLYLDLYCSLDYEMLKLVNVVCTELVL